MGLGVNESYKCLSIADHRLIEAESNVPSAIFRQKRRKLISIFWFRRWRPAKAMPMLRLGVNENIWTSKCSRPTTGHGILLLTTKVELKSQQTEVWAIIDMVWTLAPLIGLTPWSVRSACQPIDMVWCHWSQIIFFLTWAFIIKYNINISVYFFFKKIVLDQYLRKNFFWLMCFERVFLLFEKIECML
jgi:hypothetical protein